MNIFVCKFVYIVRTDQNPLESYIYICIFMMTTSAAAYPATCVPTKLPGQVGLNMRYFQIESSSLILI